MPMPKLLKRLSIKNINKRNKSVTDLPDNDTLRPERTNSEPLPPLPTKNAEHDGGQMKESSVRTRSQSMYLLPTESGSSISDYCELVTPHNWTDIPPVPPIPIQPPSVPLEDDIITSTWNTVKKSEESKNRVRKGKMVKAFEAVENQVVSTQTSHKNNALIMTTVTTGLQMTGSVKAIETGINHMLEGSQVFMKALDGVAQLHPFVGVAVMAFKAVWTLEMTRRENDRRILTLYLEMKDMIAVLIELKDVKDVDQMAPDGSTIRARMQQLANNTANDIKQCANACDTYTKKKLVVKVLSGPVWEGRLASFAIVFGKRREDFKFALAIHTAKAVDKANLGIQRIEQTTEDLNAKMDMMLQMFQSLASPEFKKIATAVDQRGGIKAVQQNRGMIKELTDLEPKSAVVTQNVSSRSKGAAAAKSTLDEVLDDLNTSPDDAIAKNMKMFDKKFEIQTNQLKEEMDKIMKHHGDRIITAVTAGPHDRIIDEDVHKVWKDMGWRGSAKTRHFVTALRDHFWDKWNVQRVSSPQSHPSGGVPTSPATAIAKEDEWALEYLNALRLQQISEAFDDDASGFVTINEVNTFTTSRLHGWSLPHWIAYWAIGWNMTLQTYQGKLQELVGKMFALLPSIRKENRTNANEYLSHTYLYTATLYNSVNRCYINAGLQGRFQSYVEMEESRLQRNLEAIGYDIDALDTLELIVGKGGIEKYLLPLLYLLLKRHLEIFRVARTRVLHEDELWDAQDTVMWVIHAVADRVGILSTVFKQQKLDPNQQFKSFAHGLFDCWNDFSKAWTGDKIREMDPPDYPYSDEFEDQDVKAEKICNYKLDQDIVDYAAYDDASFETLETRFSVNESENAPESLKLLLGSWTGSVSLGPPTSTGCIPIFLERASSDDTSSTFKATGKANDTEFTILGSYSRDETTGIINVSFKRTFPARSPPEFWAGELDIERETVSGRVSLGHELEVEDASTIDAQFVMKRMPSAILRFRPPPVIFKENKTRALWTFATAVIQSQVRNTWSWAYIKERRNARKRFIELYIRSTGVGRYLREEEATELRKIKESFTVSDIRYWHSLAHLELRLTIRHGFDCDACKGEVAGARIVCLDCTRHDSNTWDTTDICGDSHCALEEVVRDDPRKSHLPTHDVVKVHRVVHVPYMGRLERDSIAALQKARSLFQRIGEPENEGPTAKDSQVVMLQCILCQCSVKQPCWYCVQCEENTFICNACDREGEVTLNKAKKNGVYKGTHDFHLHDLVRCLQRTEEKTEINVEARMNQLEVRFASHEETMSTKLTKLEHMLERMMHRLEASRQIVKADEGSI